MAQKQERPGDDNWAGRMFGSLQEACDRLRAIVDSSYDGIYITDGRAAELAARAGADALLVDLPAFTMNPQVQDALSRWPGLPVLSMIEALLWAACRHIGVPRDQLSLPRLLTP